MESITTNLAVTLAIRDIVFVLPYVYTVVIGV